MSYRKITTVLLALSLSLLSLAACSKKEDTSSSANDFSSQASASVSESSSPSTSDPYLLLVNKTHKLPDDYDPDLVDTGDGKLAERTTAEAFKKMQNEAIGMRLYIVSGQRSIERQTNNYNNLIKEYMAQGLDKETATREASRLITPPGYSEHHTGLALDILGSGYTSLDSGFEKTPAFQWLYEHCAEYGFILRYPSDKEDVTDIEYEPWHFRYVGVENAQKIMSQKMTLEEFLGETA